MLEVRDEPRRAASASFRFSAGLSGNYFISQAAGERQRDERDEREREGERSGPAADCFFG